MRQQSLIGGAFRVSRRSFEGTFSRDGQWLAEIKARQHGAVSLMCNVTGVDLRRDADYNVVEYCLEVRDRPYRR